MSPRAPQHISSNSHESCYCYSFFFLFRGDVTAIVDPIIIMTFEHKDLCKHFELLRNTPSVKKYKTFWYAISAYQNVIYFETKVVIFFFE